jgi:hypothetical protein
MTQCTEALIDEYLERYIQGTLPEREAQKFEEHFFDCPECLAQVEALQAVTLKLGSQPRKTAKTPIPWPIRAGALAAMAAMLILGIWGLRDMHRPTAPTVANNSAAPIPLPRQSPQSAPASAASSALLRLADLTLPTFQMPNLRGQSGDPHFIAGMKAYTRQDCLSAVQALSQVPVQDEDSLAGQFYIGVCQIHLDNLNSAAATLKRVANAGDSPQQEAAFYYLAQIALERNDATNGRLYLTRTISLHGDFERRARTEISQLR